jgi:hypothetical protein
MHLTAVGTAYSVALMFQEKLSTKRSCPPEKLPTGNDVSEEILPTQRSCPQVFTEPLLFPQITKSPVNRPRRGWSSPEARRQTRITLNSAFSFNWKRLLLFLTDPLAVGRSSAAVMGC